MKEEEEKNTRRIKGENHIKIPFRKECDVKELIYT